MFASTDVHLNPTSHELHDRLDPHPMTNTEEAATCHGDLHGLAREGWFSGRQERRWAGLVFDRCTGRIASTKPTDVTEAS